MKCCVKNELCRTWLVRIFYYLISLFSSSPGYLLYEFDKFWFEEKPRDIMEFNRVKNKYQKRLLTMLKDKNTVLRCNFNKEYSNHMASVPIWLPKSPYQFEFTTTVWKKD